MYISKNKFNYTKKLSVEQISTHRRTTNPTEQSLCCIDRNEFAYPNYYNANTNCWNKLSNIISNYNGM